MEIAIGICFSGTFRGRVFFADFDCRFYNLAENKKTKRHSEPAIFGSEKSIY